MSRRTMFLLAATAALIATPAAADPECFGDSCRLPEVVDMPMAAATAPAPADEEAAAQSQASAKPPSRPVAQRAAPASKLAPSSARPQLVTEPAVRKPPVAAVAPASAPPALREVEPVLDEPAPKPRTYARAGYAASADSGALAGVPLATRPVVVGVPVIYGGYGVQPVYLVAPNAKIIHIDSED